MEKELKNFNLEEQVGDDILIKTKNRIPYAIFINGQEMSGISKIKIKSALTSDSFGHSIVLEIKVINNLTIENERE